MIDQVTEEVVLTSITSNSVNPAITDILIIVDREGRQYRFFCHACGDALSFSFASGFSDIVEYINDAWETPLAEVDFPELNRRFSVCADRYIDVAREAIVAKSSETLTTNLTETNMYKVYLKRKTKHGSEVDVTTRTTTPSPAAAAAAFRELISRTDLKGQDAAAVLSLDRKQLMYHNFDLSPGQVDYVSPDDKIKLFHNE